VALINRSFALQANNQPLSLILAIYIDAEIAGRRLNGSESISAISAAQRMRGKPGMRNQMVMAAIKKASGGKATLC